MDLKNHGRESQPPGRRWCSPVAGCRHQAILVRGGLKRRHRSGSPPRQPQPRCDAGKSIDREDDRHGAYCQPNKAGKSEGLKWKPHHAPVLALLARGARRLCRRRRVQRPRRAARAWMPARPSARSSRAIAGRAMLIAALYRSPDKRFMNLARELTGKPEPEVALTTHKSE